MTSTTTHIGFLHNLLVFLGKMLKSLKVQLGQKNRNEVIKDTDCFAVPGFAFSKSRQHHQDKMPLYRHFISFSPWRRGRKGHKIKHPQSHVTVIWPCKAWVCNFSLGEWNSCLSIFYNIDILKQFKIITPLFYFKEVLKIRKLVKQMTIC